MAEPIATVIILNWNAAGLLRDCLDAVAAQDMEPGSFLTCVADNASTDGSIEILERDYPWVTVVQTGGNLGFTGGNNAALRRLRTPYAVLLNNDALPESTWLRHLLAGFDGDQVGAVASKILFLPRYLPLTLSTEAVATHDTRPRGVRIHSTLVDGEPAHVLWEKLTYGPEPGGGTWTRPRGELLVALREGPATFSLTWVADRDKGVTISWDGGAAVLPVTSRLSTVQFELPPGTPRVDVINNAGSVVLADGYGVDRGFQSVDLGQYDRAEDVFAFCGNGVALRREVLESAGLFDDDFFLYYEDTDLSWRIRAAGWSIRYQPTAVLRHHHAASTGGESSPVFRFHVDRNRLLMLTKNASAGLALRAVLRYPLTTGSMGLRDVREGLATRRRPTLRPTWLRIRVMSSYLRLLPRMLARRRAITRGASVPRRELERWLGGAGGR